MAQNGIVKVIKPNMITGVVADAGTGQQHNYLDPNIPAGIKVGDNVSYDVVAVAGLDIAINLAIL